MVRGAVPPTERVLPGLCPRIVLRVREANETTGDISMFCSDYPHSEGIAAPLDDLRMDRAHLDMPRFCRANVDALLHY